MAEELAGGFLLAFHKGEDSYLQQYSRVVMVKVFLVGAALAIWRDSSKDLSCHLSKVSEYKDIVPKICWSLGVYVYEELRDSLSYGIPKDLEMNGMKNNTLCRTHSSSGQVDQHCKEFNRVYFKQYQYIPFFLLLFAFIYWVPYWLFELIERDVIRLRHMLRELPKRPVQPVLDVTQDDVSSLMEDKDLDEEKIHKHLDKICKIQSVTYKRKIKEAVLKLVDNFFLHPEQRFKTKHMIHFHKKREALKILFRFSYAAINLIPLFVIDYVYNGHFIFYGFNWVHEYIHVPWTLHSVKYPYLGNVFLPVIAFCDIHTVVNVNFDQLGHSKLVCEIDKHAYLQYIFLLIWIAILIGFILSPLDALLDIVDMGKTYYKYNHLASEFNAKNLKMGHMTMRQVRYLIMIRESNKELLNSLIVEIAQSRRKEILLPTRAGKNTFDGEEGGGSEEENVLLHAGDDDVQKVEVDITHKSNHYERTSML